jgi:hypothetical protein
MVNGIKALFPKLDMPYELVDTITYDPAAKDLSVEVGKAKATKAEMLMPVSRLNDAKLLVQEMVKQRWEPMAVMNPGAPGLYEQDFLKTMGKYGDFMISNVPWLDPKSAMTQALEKRHAAKFPERPARHQRRLHLRGPAGGAPGLAHRQVDQGRRADGRAAQDQDRPARHHRRADPVRRQGPERQHQGRGDPEPQAQAEPW